MDEAEREKLREEELEEEKMKGKKKGKEEQNSLLRQKDRLLEWLESGVKRGGGRERDRKQRREGKYPFTETVKGAAE